MTQELISTHCQAMLDDFKHEINMEKGKASSNMKLHDILVLIKDLRERVEILEELNDSRTG